MQLFELKKSRDIHIILDGFFKHNYYEIQNRISYI